MRTLELSASAREACARVLRKSPLFQGLSQEQHDWVLSSAELRQYDDYEALLEQGAKADFMLVLVQGSAAVLIRHDQGMQEVGCVEAPASVGEQGLLLGQARTATVAARGQIRALHLSSDAFFQLFKAAPSFGVGVGRLLAQRLKDASMELAIASSEDAKRPSSQVMSLLPLDFVVRHRVLPLATAANTVTIGVLQDPNAQTINGIRTALPSMELRFSRISSRLFDEVLSSYGGIASLETTHQPVSLSSPSANGLKSRRVQRPSPRLDPILKRMVSEGASDLHMCGSQKPFWRIDGLVRELTDARPLGSEEVFELCEPTLTQSAAESFQEHQDADYAYSLETGDRFRVNLFRDMGGVSAVFRAIPQKLLTPQQLGLPQVVQQFCHLPKGLILVTGPTGSGKTTSLAAMIDYVNSTLPRHIITLEDPVEFVHSSKKCLVNQREIGNHATSFRRALRAALREDPDIVLVGEMRDLETVDLALETASTGHLVFGTMHTSTAGQTLERIVNMFPAQQQNRIRATAAEAIRGVICQTLCAKIGGGRAAAFEVLVVNNAVASMLREGKMHQIETIMTTQRKLGNVVLNEDLARLVNQRIVDANEAMSKTLDRGDLAKRIEPALLQKLSPVNQ